MPLAGVRQMTAKATWPIIAAVQTLPKRSVAPAPRLRSRVWTCERVAFSAGSTPRIAAAAIVSAAANRIVVGFRPGSTQNGRPPVSPELKACVAHFRAKCATVSPTAAATADRTSASTNSCETMRARLAPSAKRIAISASRVAVRA